MLQASSTLTVHLLVVDVGRPHTDELTDHQNRRLSLQLVGAMGGARPEGLGFLGGGVMLGGKEPGGVAEASSKGQCQQREIS